MYFSDDLKKVIRRAPVAGGVSVANGHHQGGLVLAMQEADGSTCWVDAPSTDLCNMPQETIK